MEVYDVELAERDAYGLFRRAIEERDADAWAEIVARYRPLLIAWAARCGAALRTGEPCDDLADQALARAWMALSPDHFTRFPGMGSLIAYLRTCVITTVIDIERAQTVRERTRYRLEAGSAATPEQIVLEELDRAELWGLVSGLVETEQERVFLVERFMYGLPPQAIQLRHTNLFANVSMVYRARQNLLARLGRNPQLRSARQEHYSM
jgi:DNA-directed RNA polymerase specialized sigma24 family protein